MCIIIHRPKGVKLHEYVYRNSFNRNDDGAGISYVKDGKLVIKKGIHKLDQFMKLVDSLEDEEILIHCRLMSKGEVNDSNCHPFHVKSKLFPQFQFAIAHNGTLQWRHTKEKSDTAHFMEDALQPMLDRDPWFFDFDLNRTMMGTFIGLNNKLAVMAYDDKENETSVEFVNKKEGIMYQGCWFSNLSFTEEFSRYPNDHDRTNIDKWEPVLWTEPKTYGGTAAAWVGGMQGQLGYSSGAYGGSESGSIRGISLKEDGWKYEGGYGWYNTKANYVGTVVGIYRVKP